jgi:Domain of unknown function (DUF4394)/Calx-beta domain
MRTFTRPMLGILMIVVLAIASAPSALPPHAYAGGSTTSAFYILTTDNKIGMAVESAPGQPSAPAAVTGIAVGESLVAIDVRPQNGGLYGLAHNSVAGTVALYHIDLNSGAPVATQIGTTDTFFDNGGSPIAITATNFGIDFNPTVDLLRVVADSGLNFRMNPNSGGFVDGDLGGAPGSVGGTNPDGAIKDAVTAVDDTAYTNNAANSSVTTLYTLDGATNTLLIQNPPNAGNQTSPLPVTLNSLSLDFTSSGGLDIPPGVNAGASNAVTTGQAYAALTVGGSAGLYRIELSTGAATLVGALGGLALRDLAVAGLTPQAIAMNQAGTQLVRFAIATPGTTTTVTITSVTAGETLVGIDGRPATGQLYALGVNATANNGTLYRLDPQTGVAAIIGSSGQIALVDGAATPIDLPDPATVGYGFDFNPTADRIRVVTGSGVNFRINPNTGAAVDGDLGGSPGSVAGTNPDPLINGTTTGVTAAAYTNNFEGATVTTLYTLDEANNQLLIQNPANAGTQVNGLGVTLGGSALDFSAVSGLDIAPGVSVETAGVSASGSAYAALTVGGTTSLYRISLASGEATNLGAVGAGATALSGLAAWTAPIEITISAASTDVAEQGGDVALTVTRSGGAPLILSYTTVAGTATAGSDFTALSGTLVFASGQTTQTLTLPITNDLVDEPDETVSVQLSGPFSGTGSIALTIIDEDWNVFLPLVVR